MKKLVVSIIIVATMGLAAVAQADLSHASATLRATELAKWKAACGQGYWKCHAVIVEYCIGTTASGEDVPPQWACSVHVIRVHGTKKAQWCHVTLGLHHKTGETLYLDIECIAPPPIARDGGKHSIGKAVHRSRRLAVWELSRAGSSLTRRDDVKPEDSTSQAAIETAYKTGRSTNIATRQRDGSARKALESARTVSGRHRRGLDGDR